MLSEYFLHSLGELTLPGEEEKRLIGIIEDVLEVTGIFLLYGEILFGGVQYAHDCRREDYGRPQREEERLCG